MVKDLNLSKQTFRILVSRLKEKQLLTLQTLHLR